LRYAPYFNKLANKYQGRAIFLGVYITEAHAADEWPVGKTISFCTQPKVLSDRIGLARKFVNDQQIEFPMVVDTMDNQFDEKFASWPLRFYIVQNGKLVFKAQPNLEEFSYDPKDLSLWLKSNC